MKKYYTLITVFSIVILLLSSCKFQIPDYYIFESISECDEMEENVPEESEIRKSNIHEADHAVKQLQFNSSYAATYVFEDWEFEIIAYEFVSPEEAQKYFSNHTGKENFDATTFSAVKGISNYRIVAIDDANAYVATTSSGDSQKLNEWLQQNFSIKI